MFNKLKIQADLYGIVGLNQPYDPNYQILDADNQVSRSGYYATDNKYVKVEYLKENQDYAQISDSDFNLELKRIQETAISHVCNRVFNDVDYIDRQVLYKFAQNRINTETMTKGFICHKIEVSTKKNIAFEITRVILNFKGTGTFKLMLFNTSQDTPIFEKDITITSTNQVEPLNWRVDNSGETYKGEYYFGYLTGDGFIVDDLQPFKRDYENSNVESCITHLYTQKYLFKDHETETLPDLTKESSVDTATGLNPDITVFDDFTDLITQNEMLFAYAINLAFQKALIEVYLGSRRSNRDQRESQFKAAELRAEIDGIRGEGVVNVRGINPELLSEISNLKEQITKLREGYFGGRIKVLTLM